MPKVKCEPEWKFVYVECAFCGNETDATYGTLCDHCGEPHRISGQVIENVENIKKYHAKLLKDENPATASVLSKLHTNLRELGFTYDTEKQILKTTYEKKQELKSKPLF